MFTKVLANLHEVAKKLLASSLHIKAIMKLLLPGLPIDADKRANYLFRC